MGTLRHAAAFAALVVVAVAAGGTAATVLALVGFAFFHVVGAVVDQLEVDGTVEEVGGFYDTIISSPNWMMRLVRRPTMR